MDKNFEHQPATKGDVAEMSQVLMKEIHIVKDDLTQEIQRVEYDLTKEIQRVETKIDDGFERIEKLLGGPQGLVPRVKRLEEVVEGISARQ